MIHSMLLRIVVVEIGKLKTECVAEQTIGFGNLLDALLADNDIVSKIL